MNRRNFLKSATITPFVLTPLICVSMTTDQKPERVWTTGEHIEIIPLHWLKPLGVKCGVYTANAVDKNGKFACDDGFIYSGSEPFIVQSFRLRCLPKIFDKRAINIIIGKIHSGVKLDGKEWSVEKIVGEIKEKMEYVSMVAYAKLQADKSEGWSEQYIPIVRGLSKYRYNLYLKQLNFI